MLGRNHPTIRRLRALRREPAMRASEGLFLAEGLHLAEEAIASDAPVELVVYSDRLTRNAEGRRLLTALGERGWSCQETGHAVLEGLQDARSPQPILLLLRRPTHTLDSLLDTTARTALHVVAYGLQDPGNLGAIVRSAEAAGATACFATGETVDPFHPRAVRASMGSIFRLPVVSAAVDPLLERMREAGLRRLGASASGDGSCYDEDLTTALALFFGGEGAGLPLPLLERLDATVRIPLQAGVESLSVGAAAAVLLFEAARQRDGISRDG